MTNKEFKKRHGENCSNTFRVNCTEKDLLMWIMWIRMSILHPINVFWLKCYFIFLNLMMKCLYLHFSNSVINVILKSVLIYWRNKNYTEMFYINCIFWKYMYILYNTYQWRLKIPIQEEMIGLIVKKDWCLKSYSCLSRRGKSSRDEGFSLEILIARH